MSAQDELKEILKGLLHRTVLATTQNVEFFDDGTGTRLEFDLHCSTGIADADEWRVTELLLHFHDLMVLSFKGPELPPPDPEEAVWKRIDANLDKITGLLEALIKERS